MKKMTISNLPNDMMEEILARVPLKSNRTLQLTCKKWNTLSRNESFMKMQIVKAAREPQMILLVNDNLYSLSIDFDDDHSSTELRGKFRSLNKQVSIDAISHYCEGLLLCKLRDDTSSLMVWNPYLQQKRSIELRHSHYTHEYALGYDDKKSGRGLKILRIIDYSSRKLENRIFWYEIYNFDSDLWTTLDVTPHLWQLACSRGVSLKGNTYWCAATRNRLNELDEDYLDLVDHIICFDFTKEKFGPLLPLPSSVRVQEGEHVSLSCVREEKLAALVIHKDSNSLKIEIWITTKIEAGNISWSKFLMETEHPTIVSSFSGFLSDDFFIDEERKLAMGFNVNYPENFSIVGEAGYSRNLNFTGDVGYSRKLNFGMRILWDQGFSYAPSLVQIKEPAQGKRTRQNSLEKRKYLIKTC